MQATAIKVCGLDGFGCGESFELSGRMLPACGMPLSNGVGKDCRFHRRPVGKAVRIRINGHFLAPFFSFGASDRLFRI